MTKANANKARATKAPSADEIAAFLKAKAEQEAAAKANEANETKPETDYKALGASLLNKVCKVTKGSKHKGETVKVFFVSKGRAATDDRRAKKPIARIELEDGTKDFMNLMNLEIVGDMTQADIDRLAAEQKASQDETLYVAATCRNVGENSIQLDCKGWWKPIWFPKSQTVRMNAVTPEGTDIYEVPAWKIRQSAGGDSYENAKGKQAELEKLVNAAG